MRLFGAFILSILALILSVMPFLGLLGAPAVLLALRDRSAKKPTIRRITIGLGGAGMLVAAGWAIVLFGPERPVVHASCPRVYSADGAQLTLLSSMVASSLYPWSQRLDVDQVVSPRPEDGNCRLWVKNESSGAHHIDSIELRIAHHKPGTRVVPTISGDLALIERAARPSLAVDAAGQDVLSSLVSADERGPGGAITEGRSGEPVWQWTLEFPRPRGERAHLLLRARGTEFAESTFARYLAKMGQGMGPFMELVEEDDDIHCDCQSQLLGEELDLLHLPLTITVAPGTPHEARVAVLPYGPATLRTFTVPLNLPEDAPSERIVLRLESTPRFWEVDQALLAEGPKEYVKYMAIAPKPAKLLAASHEEDVTEWITDADRRRLAVRPGEAVFAGFDMPSRQEGAEESVFVALRGYYELPVGGKALVNPWAVLAHRLKVRSLPRFAAEQDGAVR